MNQKPSIGFYQFPFAERIRKETGMVTAAVGMITTSKHCEGIIVHGQADMVLLAREILRRTRVRGIFHLPTISGMLNFWEGKFLPSVHHF
jgi:hypothetical protein